MLHGVLFVCLNHTNLEGLAEVSFGKVRVQDGSREAVTVAIREFDGNK